MLANSLLRSSKQSSDKLFFNTISAGAAMGTPSCAYNHINKNVIYTAIYLNNAYVYAVNTKGEIVWQKVITSTFNSTSAIVSVNTTGTIFVLVRIASTPASLNVVRLDSSGAFLGASNITDTVDISPGRPVANASGDIYVPISVTTTPTKMGVLKLNSSGVLQWGRQITDTVNIDLVGISIEASGSILVNARRNTSGQRTFIHRLDSSGTQTGSVGFSPSTEAHHVVATSDGGFILVGGTSASTTRGFTRYNSSFSSVSSFSSSLYNGTAFTSANTVDGKVVAVVFNLDQYVVASQDLSSIYVRSTTSSTYTHSPFSVTDINGKMLLSGTAQSTGAYNNAMGSRIDLSNDLGNYGTSAFNISSVASTWVTATAPTTQTVTSTVSNYNPTVTSVTPTVANSSHTAQIFLKV